jgi:hypothetical protein
MPRPLISNRSAVYLEVIMRKVTNQVLLVAVFSFILNSCGPSPSPTATPTALTPTKASPTSTQTPTPEGETIIVASTADSGPGTLRQALLDAQSGDTITFDPSVFPPSAPVEIPIASELPHIHQGNLTIDGSNAGVILDGRNAPGAWVGGLQIVSDGNTIQGFQVSNFSGAGIAISTGAHNLVGGDRSVGAGPFGQGNLTIHNDIGIGLWGSRVSFNTIRGNLIGSDATGANDMGNHNTGVVILEGASNNTIGPDNIVAHNGGAGIEVLHSPDSLHNTFTQNSIHDNGGNGITLQASGIGKVAAPVLLDFDLQAGTLTGVACANCAVEIFSDSSDEGEIYEGQVIADSTGTFAYNKGSSFASAHLTATATEPDGSTSSFSPTTTGTSGSLIAQADNPSPRTALASNQSGDLDDNRIASHWHGLWEWSKLTELLNETLYIGVKRYRLSINNGDQDKVDWSQSEFSVDPSHDAFITDLANNNIQITYFLSFWDKETWPGGVGAACPRFKTEEEIEHYLEYVRFIVGHFKDRVQIYEIYNEPDNTACPQWIEVEDYINLVRRAVPVIRQEYPDAKIQVGGVAGLSNPYGQAYLFSIIESDIMPLVDIVSWHPFYGNSPEADAEYYFAYPSIVQNIKDTAASHGFTGEYAGEEMNWRPASDPDTVHPSHYTMLESAKYQIRGILIHLGIDVIAGNLRIPHNYTATTFAVRNLSTVMVGAGTTSLPLTVETEATRFTSYSFSLPNGDLLIAEWSDGIAVDHDPGIPSKLVIPGFAGWNATAIDILHGFEQELISSNENGDLIIRDILIKDYPVIIRLSR